MDGGSVVRLDQLMRGAISRHIGVGVAYQVRSRISRTARDVSGATAGLCFLEKSRIVRKIFREQTVNMGHVTSQGDFNEVGFVHWDVIDELLDMAIRWWDEQDGPRRLPTD